MCRTLITAIAVLISSTATAEEIPLKSVWARYMPGTQDARKLDPKLTSNIAKWLMRRSDERGKAESCFLVPGEGKVALQAAANVLMNGGEPSTNRPGQEASLFFYSFAAPGYVQIESIEREEGKIVVQFQVVTHQEALSTTHFALIPLGKLPAGEIKVEIVEVDPEKPYENRELTKRVVCKSCTIDVKDGAKK